MHILNSLQMAQACFATKDVEQYDLLISYLEAAVLDDEVTKIIQNERRELTKELTKQQEASGGYPNNTIIRFRSGFITVKYIFRYLNDILELNSVDIASVVGGINEQ
jgi:hypothetical protein